MLHGPLEIEENPFVLLEGKALAAAADKENRAREDRLRRQQSLPVSEKSTRSCQMQSCRTLCPGELNPRRFTRKQPSG